MIRYNFMKLEYGMC